MQKWLTDEKRRSIALGPFEDFTSFVTSYTGQRPPAYANNWSGFIGNKTVGILCLNSAWMCGRKKESQGEVNDYGCLTLGEPQVHAALAAIQNADVRLAVLHHPFDWLARFDRNRVEKRLKQDCHFILHGHEHQPDFKLDSGLSGECAVIPAGACFERRAARDPRYLNAYNFVHLDFEAGQGVIFLRRWSDRRNEWTEDNDSHPGGRFPFRLPKELGSPKQSRSPKAVLPSALAGAAGESAAVAAYCERLTEVTSKLELIGLGHGVQIELPIEQAYIPLNVTVTRDLQKEHPGRYDAELLQQREHCDANVFLCDIFKWAALFGDRGVLLLGDPGAGKTTGARQFCWRVLTEADLPKTLGLPAGTVPVFLRLRNVTPQHLAQGLAVFITGGVASSSLPPDRAQPGPDLLARQGVLWIFDGLDEVASEEARVRVCGWIRQALGDRPHDFFLVTSRYQGYQGTVDLGPAFCEFHVKPLDETQVAKFVGHWYRAVAGRLHGADAEYLAKAAAEARALMDLLDQPEYKVGHLRQLPANPLLLTILCLVHHQDHNLPRRRADLYARCVRVLLEHWAQEKRKLQAVASFDPEAAEGVLSSVAWWLHEKDNRTSLTVAELGAVAAKALADLAPGTGLGRDGEAFIKRMRDESGILAMWSAGQCGFLHLTFQEYLASLHAAREGRAEALVQHVGKSWWREVILVAVAVGSQDFALKFFAALLQTPALEKEGAFVDQCLDEARYAVLEPFIGMLRAKGAQPERQVAILRRLRQFTHDDLTAVCRELARVAHPEVSALAREVLQRAGVAVERQAIEVLGAPLELRVDQKTGIAYITIPAGEFEMGWSGGAYDEKPVHRVHVSMPFLLRKYTATNQEYQRFLEANPGVKPPELWSNSQFNGPTQPVVGVSWEETQVFCRWAGCRLPTEAEWEYACRAGSRQKYCFGDDESKLGEYAWYLNNSGANLHPVGEKKPNAWGLFDMHGNVWEWCQDRFASDYHKRSPKTDPFGPEKGGARVLRGGSFAGDPVALRCGYRLHGDPDFRNISFGFRVVCVGASAR